MQQSCNRSPLLMTVKIFEFVEFVFELICTIFIIFPSLINNFQKTFLIKLFKLHKV